MDLPVLLSDGQTIAEGFLRPELVGHKLMITKNGPLCEVGWVFVRREDFRHCLDSY